jgi:hypothetical protein
MNRREFLSGAAAALTVGAITGAALPAYAAKGSVALLPASVTTGNPRNGVVFTDALRASLEKQGFTVLPAANVQSTLKAQQLEGQKILSTEQISKVRDALSADYVVYPRVLGVGLAVGDPAQLQATVLVNVQGKDKLPYIHTKQVGQTFGANGASRQNAVIGRADADAAVGKLLEGFYEKAGK